MTHADMINMMMMIFFSKWFHLESSSIRVYSHSWLSYNFSNFLLYKSVCVLVPFGTFNWIEIVFFFLVLFTPYSLYYCLFHKIGSETTTTLPMFHIVSMGVYKWWWCCVSGNYLSVTTKYIQVRYNSERKNFLEKISNVPEKSFRKTMFQEQ